MIEALANLPDEIKQIAGGFPFSTGPFPRPKIRALIKENLPTYERATSLVEAYLENLSWFSRPIKREQAMEELLPLLYKREWTEASEEDRTRESPEMHQLALALGLFSCGAVVDLTLPPHNAEAILYNHLCRAALSLESVFASSSFETVQTVVLISKFEFFTSKKATLESAWKLLSFGFILATGVSKPPNYVAFSHLNHIYRADGVASVCSFNNMINC